MSDAQGIRVPAEPTTTPTDGGVVQSGNGFLTGADPRANPMTAAEWQAANGGNGQGYVQGNPGQPIQQGQQPVTQQGQTFTAEDIARARQEEKDKLYGRIEEMSTQMQTLVADREAREQAERERQEALAEQERKVQEEALDTRQLLEQRQQEWDQRFRSLEEERDRERALREQESRYNAVQEYRRSRIEQTSNSIMPELRDLVHGNSEEEIEASITEMQNRTEAIMASVQGVVSQQRQQSRGVGITAPPIGPMEQQTSYETLTPEQIRAMDMPTYAKYRERLMQAGRQQQQR